MLQRPPNRELRIDQVRRSFAVAGAAPLVALDGVSLHCPSGSFTALIGPSGCGKSTLLRLIAGLEQPDSGSLQIGGESPLALQRRGKLGIAFQDAALLPWRSVLDNVRLPLDVIGGATAADLQRIGTLVELVGLRGFEHALPSQLSGGMRQRVAIARALVTQPEVLLLDEPLAGMGAEETERMLALLAELKASHAILLVEHDMDAVFRIADRITVMVNGAVIASGNPDFVRNNAQVRVAYLGEH